MSESYTILITFPTGSPIEDICQVFDNFLQSKRGEKDFKGGWLDQVLSRTAPFIFSAPYGDLFGMGGQFKWNNTDPITISWLKELFWLLYKHGHISYHDKANVTIEGYHSIETKTLSFARFKDEESVDEDQKEYFPANIVMTEWGHPGWDLRA